ncbi:MAG: SprT-like domain-containing protein [Flavobacteriales bacterium]|jgi:SprT protein|nr:SprT-like domain-containing protein [Flavobacteriales bacterium]
MDREERIRNAIRPFVPAGTEVPLAEKIVKSRCHLTITRDRKTKAGDYRHPFGNQGHRISVNGTLNQFAFLITFVHEMAHLTNWERHGRKVNPHGKEWKMAFQEEMLPFLREDVFPDDILKQLRIHMKSPKSATVRDLDLMRLLKSYDDPSHKVLLEDVPENEEFQLGSKRFIKGVKLRKRFRCELVGTGRIYLVSAIAEVEL